MCLLLYNLEDAILHMLCIGTWMRIIHPLRSVSEGESICATSSLGEKMMKGKCKQLPGRLCNNFQQQICPQPKYLWGTHESRLPSAWTLYESQQDGSLLYCMQRSDPPTVIRSVTVSSDLHWHAHVLGKVVPRSNSVIQTLPVKVSAESSLLQILTTIQSAKLCPGNPE